MQLNLNSQSRMICGAILIGIIIFCILGLPFTKWGFLHDDFGVIWHVFNTKFHQIWFFFIEKSASCFVQPSNFTDFEQTFLSIFYRPLYNIFYFIQKFFFGLQPYGYFLTTIFFHAINSTLVFYAYSQFFEFQYAFWGALYFGFHLSLWDWMGWIAGQQQVINLTCMLLVVLFSFQFLHTKKVASMVVACFFYITSLFLRETIIVMPFWFPIAAWFHAYFQSTNWLWKRVFALCSVFFSLNFFYIALRLWLYPLKVVGSGVKISLSPFDFMKNLQNRFFDAVTMTVDVLNLSWLAGGHRHLKGFLIMLVVVLLCWLLYKNSQRKIILFLVFSIIPFLWPAILRYYSSRYLYKVLPFIIAIVILLITCYQTTKPQKFQKISRLILWGILCINGWLLFNHFKERENALNKINQAFKTLAISLPHQHQPLCFVGLPYETFPSGVAQAMWLHGINPSTPIYYDTSTFLWFKKRPVIDPLKITIKDNVITLMVLDETNSWFNPFNQFGRMGECIKYNIDPTSGMPRLLVQTLDKKYVTQNLLFITWDYKNWRFKIL
jgi:hypothetical protein